jgi:hypothetical protein
MINPSAAPHCEKEEILRGLVPGSLIERIFGKASLVLIADHAKESRKWGLQCAHLKLNYCLFSSFFV